MGGGPDTGDDPDTVAGDAVSGLAEGRAGSARAAETREMPWSYIMRHHARWSCTMLLVLHAFRRANYKTLGPA